MDPPPPPATNPIPAAVKHASYAESVESSPRSRATETWDDRESLTVPGGGGGGKLRFMCSYGGYIIPRPHDKSLCYVGGDTRMFVVDRNTSLSELNARLSKTLLHSRGFTLKYQLPNEDLDSLISVTSDEDLENMIDEFDRICGSSSGAKSNRLRVFLFVNEGDSGSSIESIMGSSVKSDDWFYSALNGSGASVRGLGFADVNSVNSLLGLEKDSSISVNDGGNVRLGNSRALEDLQADLSKSNQKSIIQDDVTLNPDSLMIETSSSFGSASSSPLLANLPPIRVRVEDGGNVNGAGNKVEDQRGVVEEQFAQMSVSAGGRQDEGFSAMAPYPLIPTTVVPSTLVQGIQVYPGMSRGEFPERHVSDDERSDQGVPVGYGRRQPQLQTQLQQQQALQQQKPSGIFDIASPDSTSSDGSMLYPDPVAQIPSGFSRVTSNPVDSSNPRMQVQQKVSESANMLHSQLEQHELQQQIQQQKLQPQQLQQLQPQQFIHPGTHYIQHPQNAKPISQYYHPYPPQHHHPQHDQQQYPFYFIPPTTARQPQQAYNMCMQQGTYKEPSDAVIPSRHPTVPTTMITNPSANNQPRNVALGNPGMTSNVYRAAIPKAQPMVQVAPGHLQQQYIGYSQVHHPPQSVAPATIPNYVYEYSDPTHAQIYYTQPLAHPAQMADASSSQNPTDNMKHQNKISQAQ